MPGKRFLIIEIDQGSFCWIRVYITIDITAKNVNWLLEYLQNTIFTWQKMPNMAVKIFLKNLLSRNSCLSIIPPNQAFAVPSR